MPPDDPTPEPKTAPRRESRERNKRVTVRFLDAEYAALKERAELAGMSLGSYLRASAIGSAGPRAKRSPTMDRAIAARAIAELNKAGSNLNQMAHSLNLFLAPEGPNVIAACDAVKAAALEILHAFGFKTHDRQRKSS